MDSLLKKLNYKDALTVHILNCPPELKGLLKSFPEGVSVSESVGSNDKVWFAIGFAQMQQAVDAIAEEVCPLLDGDAILWMCYPKGSSKRYKCDFNRDTGWNAFGKYAIEPVRQVAIDEDWSALRFRKVSYIAKLTRKFDTLSKEGAEMASKHK